MRKLLLSTLILLAIHLFSFNKTNAQSLELVGGNIINGAITGSALGVATMGLTNSSDFAPLRIGLGVGILGGTGVALYDISTLPQGQTFFVSGVFNDGQNSSIIILLDTLYGSVAGVAVGSAVALINNNSIMDGLQYGASAGAWFGFGFGVVDAFFIAERNNDFISAILTNRDSVIDIQSENSSFKMLQPDLVGVTDLSGTSLQYRVEPTVNLFTYRRQF
tara:strand:- start:3573 stop:4232 length:660 start_codon:yes stop_codon:yes gene_type:complete